MVRVAFLVLWKFTNTAKIIIFLWFLFGGVVYVRLLCVLALFAKVERTTFNIRHWELRFGVQRHRRQGLCGFVGASCTEFFRWHQVWFCLHYIVVMQYCIRTPLHEIILCQSAQKLFLINHLTSGTHMYTNEGSCTIPSI